VPKHRFSSTKWVGRAVRRDVAPQRRALATCLRRSRPCAARGRPQPQAMQPSRRPAPRDASESAPAPHAGATRAPCRPDAPPSVRRSVRDLPPSCAVPRPEHHIVITTGRVVPLFKRSPRLFAPPDRAVVVLPRHRGHRRQAAALLRLWASARVSNFLRARSTFPNHGFPPVRTPLAGA
jgi:hypothetical protein